MWSTPAPLSEPTEEDMDYGEHAGPAKRRRERQLRQFLRHERKTSKTTMLPEARTHTLFDADIKNQMTTTMAFTSLLTDRNNL